MKAYRLQIGILCKRLAWVFVLFTISRVLFYLLNRSYFQNLGFGELLSVCFFGLRFDVFSIFVINSVFILLSALPFRFVFARNYQRVLLWIFTITNALGLLLNFIDFAYFPFTQKRTTYDVFNMAFGGQSEMGKLVPLFLKDYWYVVLLYMLCVWGLMNRYKRILIPQQITYSYTTKNSVGYLLIFTLIVGLTVLGIRGGMQRVPISIVDGGKFTEPQYIPILLNTPFSIIKSAELKTIPELSLMSDEQAAHFVNPVHTPDTGTFRPMNVCVIILESFSKEYTGLGKRHSYTPFLDSLAQYALVFDNAYANGKKSIEGIPSILASMPSLMDDPYLNSYYSTNTINSLPGILKTKGYSSAFFHGGTNGTMNFDAFCKLAGFDKYYGRSEYGNDADYDGQWGIWDEPFLKYTAKTIGTMKQPFVASLFTLSSHHPFKVPEVYKNRFPKGSLEIHESIGYSDYALRRFFEESAGQDWFKNTLFVITPDHTGISEDPFYSNIKGQYSIPVLFYTADHSMKGHSGKVIQQIDLLPSILDLLHYDAPYYCFGTSVYKQKHPALYYNNGTYYLASDSLFFSVNDLKINQVFDAYNDSLLQHPLTAGRDREKAYMEEYIKAFLQTYNNSIIHNKTHL